MPRLALFNMLIGFFLIFLAASAGFFLATEAESAYLHDPSVLLSYAYRLQKSAHAHTNLFGMIHILFGLTLPYSQLSLLSKKVQTVGFSIGSLCMSFMLFIKAGKQPLASLDVLSIAIGIGLSLFLLAFSFTSLALL